MKALLNLMSDTAIAPLANKTRCHLAEIAAFNGLDEAAEAVWMLQQLNLRQGITTYRAFRKLGATMVGQFFNDSYTARLNYDENVARLVEDLVKWSDEEDQLPDAAWHNPLPDDFFGLNPDATNIIYFANRPESTRVRFGNTLSLLALRNLAVYHEEAGGNPQRLAERICAEAEFYS